jgi:hypothetical protein
MTPKPPISPAKQRTLDLCERAERLLGKGHEAAQKHAPEVAGRWAMALHLAQGLRSELQAPGTSVRQVVEAFSSIAQAARQARGK